MQAFCVADEDTVRGLRLAGIPGQPVATPEEAADAVVAALRRPGCGLLIVTEQVAVALGPRLVTLRAERSLPVVVELPGPGGPAPGAGRERLGRLVRSLVGAGLEGDP